MEGLTILFTLSFWLLLRFLVFILPRDVVGLGVDEHLNSFCL